MNLAQRMIKADEFKKKIENSYSWELTDFEKLVRNEWERLVAQAIISEHPSDEAGYNEIVEYQQDCNSAEETLNECDETKHELAKNLTPEQVKEAKELAKLIFEI